MGKTRNLFKKIGDIKEIFHARMGTIKDRNHKDLTEAEEIKKRWQEYTEELSKKILMTWITMMVWSLRSVQFSSVAQSCSTLRDPTDCKMPGFPVHHQLPEFAQTHVH